VVFVERCLGPRYLLFRVSTVMAFLYTREVNHTRTFKMSYAAEFAFSKGVLKNDSFCRNAKRFMTRAEALTEARNLKKENAGCISRTRIVRTKDPVNFCYRAGRLVQAQVIVRHH
jgi:hypothetical protein